MVAERTLKLMVNHMFDGCKLIEKHITKRQRWWIITHSCLPINNFVKTGNTQFDTLVNAHCVVCTMYTVHAIRLLKMIQIKLNWIHTVLSMGKMALAWCATKGQTDGGTDIVNWISFAGIYYINWHSIKLHCVYSLLFLFFSFAVTSLRQSDDEMTLEIKVVQFIWTTTSNRTTTTFTFKYILSCRQLWRPTNIENNIIWSSWRRKFICFLRNSVCTEHGFSPSIYDDFTPHLS